VILFLIVPPEISRAIREFGLGRHALLTLLNTLRQELEDNLASYKHQRDPTYPDLYFWFALSIWDQGEHRTFRLTVDDARATDRLFLVAAEEV
jgi:hypothetical protein